MESISGTVDCVTEYNPDNGFFVVRIIDGERRHVRVTGHAPRVIPGETLSAEGSWAVFDSQRQFESSKVEITPPRSIDGIRRYLASGAIRGIGPAYADKLVSAFGNDVFNVIDRSPERLREIGGIGEERANSIIQAWQDQRAIREIMVFLHANGATTAKAARIYSRYGADAIMVVLKDPYQLANDIDGMGFLSADQIAKKVGFDLCSPERLRAGVTQALNEAAANGHTAVRKIDLVASACKLLDAPSAQIDDAIYSGIFDETLIVAEKEGETFVALPPIHYAEKGVASRLARLSADLPAWLTGTLEKRPDASCTHSEEGLNHSQALAVHYALQSKVSIVVGGIDTGVERVLQSVVREHLKRGRKIALVAPGSAAAVRITAATGVMATTIARLVEAYRENDAAYCDVQVITVFDASVLDTSQVNALLKSIPSCATLVLIGDVDLFPSVGPGQVFRDLITSELFPTVILQADLQQVPSDITRNARKIALGEYPETPGIASKSSFRFLYAPDAKTAARRVVDLVSQELPGWLGIDPIRDIQVLCLMSRGECGTRALNIELAKKLNRTETRKIEINGMVLRVGDRVTARSKRREKEASAGDIGSIVCIDIERRRVQVDFYGRSDEYSFEQVNSLALAFATPLQRAAGHRFPVVIIPVVTQHFMMLHRSLLYTGVSSGEKLVILVGQPKALAIAVKNNDDNNRSTLLNELLLAELKRPTK